MLFEIEQALTLLLWKYQKSTILELYSNFMLI